MYLTNPETILSMPLVTFERLYGFRPKTPMDKAVFAFYGGKLPKGFDPWVVESLWALNRTSERANMEEIGTTDDTLKVLRAIKLDPNADPEIVETAKLAVIEAVCLE